MLKTILSISSSVFRGLKRLGTRADWNYEGLSRFIRKEILMANPVVHFEIIGKNAPLLRDYYKELFDWHSDTNSAVAPEVSAPGNYGFIDKTATEDGTGIPGGIGGGADYAS